MDRILEAALEHGTILEINSNPERLDLNDIYARRAAEMSINTDAHRPEHLAFRSLGVGIARRAWLTSKQVVNCWTAARMQKWLEARG
jgi:DNA polymerase (family 10)